MGSPLLWRGNYEGKEMVFVKGIILEIQPGQLLKYNVIDPFASYPDIPENYLNERYKLTEHDGSTELTVSQDSFETAAEGDKRYQDVCNNGECWNPILIEIKKLVKAG